MKKGANYKIEQSETPMSQIPTYPGTSGHIGANRDKAKFILVKLGNFSQLFTLAYKLFSKTNPNPPPQITHFIAFRVFYG